MNLHKRSCCSTCVPRKISMEFAKDSRKKTNYSRRMAVPGKRNFDQQPHTFQQMMLFLEKQSDFHKVRLGG